MPREQLAINNFERGMVSSADSMDIAKNVCYWCRDIELSDRPGQLIGRPGDEDKSTAIGAVGNAQGYGWINKLDGKYTLVFFDYTDSKVKYIEDVYGTPGALTDLETISGAAQNRRVFVARNQTLRSNGISTTGVRSTPRWCGYTSNSIFGSSSTSLLVVNQECAGTFSSSTNGHFYVSAVSGSLGAASFFAQTKKYYYKIAIEYDGYQISVLEDNAYGLLTNYFDTGSSSYTSLSATIRARGGATAASSFNKRVTGICLFRAEGSNSLSAPETEFRLVQRIAISDSGWATAATDHKDIIIVDTGAEASTYEAYSGLAETATASIVQWALGCQADNYMFIGNCSHSSLEDAPYIIFRSVSGRFDIYDFQSSAPAILRLPNIPTAMIYFLGQLLVFDQSNIYRINPGTLSIETVISGYGCVSQQSLVVTQYGVFFADTNGIHLYDGRAVKTITSPIYEFVESVTYNIGSGNTSVPDYSYKTLSTAFTDANPPKLTYFGKFKMLIFSVSLSGVTVVYGYNIDNATFSQFTVPDSTAGTSFSFIVGKDGEIYIAYRVSTTNYLYKFMSAPGSRKAFTWLSAKISFNDGDEQQYQKIYYLKTTKSSDVNALVFYGKDNGTVDNTPNSATGAITTPLCKSFRFILASTVVNQYFNNATVIFRRLVGRR